MKFTTGLNQNQFFAQQTCINRMDNSGSGSDSGAISRNKTDIFIGCYLKGTPSVSRRELNPDPISSRVPETARPVINGGRRGHHVEELRLVRGCHHHHIGKACHESDVEGTAVRRPVRPHQPRPVHRESHRQLLQVHVVHHLENNQLNL